MLFSTEQVSKYHPDKYADQISDAILAECLRQDPNSHCGIETMVKNDIVVLGGEITSEADFDIEKVVRTVAGKLDYKVGAVVNLLSKQSPEINNAVVSEENIGAGDQGMMFGYATNETESKLPFGFDLANRIIAAVENDIAENPNTIFRGDAKTEVTVDLSKPADLESVDTVLISVCERDRYSVADVADYVKAVLKPLGIDEHVKLIVNPSGIWTIGGAEADCGLTGRKIVCDQYGGYIPVGGGSFSGKDPSKVDRSAAYMAREIAKKLVDQYELKNCSVQLAYAIGIAEPISVNVTNDKGLDLVDEVRRTYDLTPKGIIKALDLYNAPYAEIAGGCHYRKNFFNL